MRCAGGAGPQPLGKRYGIFFVANYFAKHDTCSVFLGALSFSLSFEKNRISNHDQKRTATGDPARTRHIINDRGCSNARRSVRFDTSARPRLDPLPLRDALRASHLKKKKVQATCTGMLVDSNGTLYTSDSSQLIRFDTTVATGGDQVYDVNGYTVHIFEQSGSFVMNVPSVVEYMIVGGGGAGGHGTNGGGGGGGAVIFEQVELSKRTYAVTVGTGGTSPTTVSEAIGRAGLASSFNSRTANGGGGGGTWSNKNAPSAGGSGGGGSRDNGNGGSTTAVAPARAFAGGNSGGRYRVGGGGGAGAVGTTHGGDGYLSAITGTSLYWAGGGGGAGLSQLGPSSGGNGGRGGGGGGALVPYGLTGASGLGGTGYNAGGAGARTNTQDQCHGGIAGANTGGGGGGAAGRGDLRSLGWGQGGSGGSGIVVVRYPIGG